MTWRTFVRAHRHALFAADFFTTEVWIVRASCQRDRGPLVGRNQHMPCMSNREGRHIFFLRARARRFCFPKLAGARM